MKNSTLQRFRCYMCDNDDCDVSTDKGTFICKEAIYVSNSNRLVYYNIKTPRGKTIYALKNYTNFFIFFLFL